MSFAEDPQSFKEFVQKTTVNGNLRGYYFTRDFGNPELDNRRSVSLGGRINIYTAEIKGISAGASYYAADALGLNASGYAKNDNSLPAHSVNVLGQSFLQYKNRYGLLRGGNQLIHTPWMNQSDSRMIPATYQGVYTTLSPNNNFQITALRMYRFKSRTSKNFDRNNLYSPENFGGTPIPALAGVATLGAFASGINYTNHGFKSQAWYYLFYDYANLLYTDMNYQFPTPTRIKPFLGAQAAYEWGAGKNLINTVGLGKTDAKLLGISLGVKISEGELSLGYDVIPTSRGAYSAGDFVSPYTTGYVTDPLYTSSMIAGLVEKAAGSAAKLTGKYFLYERQLVLSASYAKYFTSPNTQNTTEADFDIAYVFKKTYLKGLSLRNRLGILNGNPTFKRYVYNRVMFQYEF